MYFSLKERNMRTIMLLVCSVTVFSVSAQIAVSDNKNTLFNTVLPFSGGLPVNNTRYVDLSSGSPFFQKEWVKSRVVTQDMSVYKDVTVRIDLLENKVHYRDSTGKELVIGSPLREIVFPQFSTGMEVRFINGNMLPVEKKGFFQLLINDSIALLKGFVKTFESHVSYGSAAEYSIKTVENYFALYNNREYQIRKLSDFTDILPSGKAEIEAYLKTVGKKLSRDEQFTAAAKFCNSLIRK